MLRSLENATKTITMMDILNRGSSKIIDIKATNKNSDRFTITVKSKYANKTGPLLPLRTCLEHKCI